METEEMMMVVQKYLSKEGKITQYPAKKSLRPYVLAFLAGKFDSDRKYTEKEVNAIIQDSITFSDHELIRREMIIYHQLDRLRDGSAYWVAEQGQ